MPVQQVTQLLRDGQEVSYSVPLAMTLVNYGNGWLRVSMNSIDPALGAANCFLLGTNMSYSAKYPVDFMLKILAEKDVTFTLITGMEGAVANVPKTGNPPMIAEQE